MTAPATVTDAARVRGLAIAIVVAVTGIASAEPATDTPAATIFQQGRELAKAGRFAEACALFDRSYELDPALGTAVNLADCLERQGQRRRAWLLFDRVARESQQVQSRARLARQRADALIAQLATLILTLPDASAPGLAVRLGDRAVPPAAEIRDVIEPGEVALVVTWPRRPVFRTVIRAVAGATLRVTVPAAEPVAPATRRRRSRLYLAGGAGAAGVVGLGVSLGLAISAKRLYDGAFDDGSCMHAEPDARCTPAGKREIDRAGTRADLATGFAIGGAVLAGVGAALFFTAPRETIQVAPIATAHALGVGLVGRF